MSRSLAELYLAYRQAKNAIFSERRTIGLANLASYESDLEANLKRLHDRVQDQAAWFDDVSIGEVLVTPKSLRPSQPKKGLVVEIGQTQSSQRQVDINSRLILVPTIDFAIIEILYLAAFGPALESALSSSVVGYRLKLHGGKLDPHTRRIFGYWPKQYDEFRTTPLKCPSTWVSSREACLVTSFDFASFYDSIDATFLLSSDFLREIDGGPRQIDTRAFSAATRSLLSAFGRFHSKCSQISGFPVNAGVPIGALTSRLIANLALIPVDERIGGAKDVVCYRRYVDDVIVVSKVLAEGEVEAARVLTQWLPLKKGRSSNELDTKALGRDGSSLSIQPEKTAVYRLSGAEGSDFLTAVIADQRLVVSERRAVLDTRMLRPDHLASLARSGGSHKARLRVLREKDRRRLAAMELSTGLMFLERVAQLVESKEAEETVRDSLEKLVRLLPQSSDWLDATQLVVRLLRISLLARDWTTTAELMKFADSVWSNMASLRARVKNIFWNERAISQQPAIDALLTYFQKRWFEAAASSITRLRSQNAPALALQVGSTAMQFSDVQDWADALATADLRHLDREDESARGEPSPVDHTFLSLVKTLKQTPELEEVLGSLDEFRATCHSLGDRAWLSPPLSLHLLTRPPTYFDVARRVHSKTDIAGFKASSFTRLLELVNALRGTRYWNPVGEVVSSNHVRLLTETVFQLQPVNTRIILGNLVIEEAWFTGAATPTPNSLDGSPSLTLKRLSDLSHILSRASFAARQRSGRGTATMSVLVLPELSIPRRWARFVANHAVRTGEYAVVMGLEYAHVPMTPYVFNQVWGVFPGPFSSVAAFVWTKGQPARVEAQSLQALAVRFAPMTHHRRAILETPMGRMSVLICSELLEPRLVANLFSSTELILAPAWNKDTVSYDQLVHSVGIQTHSILAISNNGHYSDCRVWAPHRIRWQRDQCRLIQRDTNTVTWVDLPTAQLRGIHDGAPDSARSWMPLPPGWQIVRKSSQMKGSTSGIALPPGPLNIA